MSGEANSAPSQPGYSSADFLLSQYKVGKTLGVGSFGKVKVAEHILTGHKVAIKILNRRKIASMDMEEKVRREIKIATLFQHPHIIRLFEVIRTPLDIYVVMEYVKGGELFDYIVEKGRLLEDEARHFFQQIISGLEYCHRNMVVHRDLKPENLLLDGKSHIKLADFGLSNMMRDGHFLKTSCGSPNYAAPEVISGKLYAGPEVDVWSCGVILYALLCGSLPFDDENIPNLFKKIKNGVYTLPTHLSPGARHLISRMLLVDPLKRITIPEIRQHPWFAVLLPRYLAVMQAEPIGPVHLDKEILAQCINLGFDHDALVDDVKCRRTTKGSVTYWLSLTSRSNNQSAKNDYLQRQLCETSQAQLQQPSGIMVQIADEQGRGSQPPQTQSQRLTAERHWRLGVRCSKSASSVCLELQTAFVALGVLWKRLGPYTYKCRMPTPLPARKLSDDMDDDMHTERPHGDSPSEPRKDLKFEVQIYRVRTQMYLLDVQRLEGHLYLFLDLCAELISQLHLDAPPAPAQRESAPQPNGSDFMSQH